jgi:hypothetical protein
MTEAANSRVCLFVRVLGASRPLPASDLMRGEVMGFGAGGVFFAISKYLFG